MKTIVDIFLESTDKFKDNVALQMVSEKKEEAIFYFQLRANVEKIIAELNAWGVKKNDRIAILSENRPQWAWAYFAILGTGAVVVGIDINLKPQEISFILRDAEVRTVFVSEFFLSPILELKKEAGLKKIICFDEIELKDGYILSDILKNNPYPVQYPLISSDDLAMLVYTSGTTGKSKAVMLSHRNISANIEIIQRTFKWGKQDNFLSLLPLSHMFELTCGLLAPLSCGAKITYIDSLKPAIMVKAMQKTKVTHALVVPAIIRLLRLEILKEITHYSLKKKAIFYLGFGLCAIFRILNINLGKLIFAKVHRNLGAHLKYFVSGGAPLSPYLIWWFGVLGIAILQGYGLTETAPVVSVNTPMENRIGSVGKPLPGIEVKVKDDLDEGEILVKGENVMLGYYKNPEETAKSLRDGWLYTGDMGKIDSHGYLYILGREKNLIVRESGLKVYPEEIEEELLKSPLIREVCIIGKKERGSLEEVVYALIVPNEEYIGLNLANNREKIKELITNEIKALDSCFATYKHIHDFELWPELPKTATRKVKKELVKKTLSQQPV